jgi:hypothetical protein
VTASAPEIDMGDVSIAVATSDRQTRRQVARALRSGGMRVTFLDTAEQTADSLASGGHRMIIVDSDSGDPKTIEKALEMLAKLPQPIPLVLLSLRPDKGPMLSLLESYEVSHLVAKHGAIRVSKANATRPVYAMLDERELLVTCEKVLSGDIFGIEKYIGAWGVAFHRRTIRGMKDKTPFLDEFERYLRDMEMPAPVIPEMVTVAEEFLLNAIVHAPRDNKGQPKYESLGPSPSLEPPEYVSVVYGCDGQRLMISVSDNFGTLNKHTLYDYLRRGFATGIEPETKPSGAGLGLSLSLRSIHQLVFNVQDGKRTEAIAGWFMRVQSASEFKQVGKSLNLFWVHANAKPDVQLTKPREEAVYLRGRIDESFDFGNAAECAVVDMRDVTTVTSRGLIRWIEFIRSMKDKRPALVAFPESLVFQATTVNGVIEGATVRSVLAPFECPACGFEERRELPPAEVLPSPGGPCPECKGTMRFAGLVPEFEAFLEALRSA